MKSITIKPVKRLYGTIEMPGDKSISHRAVMLGAIAKGRTRIKGLGTCDDCNYTIEAFRRMGIIIEKRPGLTSIEGRGLRGIRQPDSTIDVGESGTTMRLISGILAGQDFEVTLDGAPSLSKRPMDRIIAPLSLMGADIRAASGGYPPLNIRGGRLRPIDYNIPVPSAQVKSAVLLAALYADGVTRLQEVFKSRDHTERMLKHFGGRVKMEGLRVSVEGGTELEPKAIEVPGDISSAAFFMVGAVLLKGSKVRIKNVGINPTRAGVLDILGRMGARVNVLNRKESFEPAGDIEVESGATKGTVIEAGIIPSVIDELPAIFVLASLSKGRTVIKGAGELKVKETDRIHSMKENLGRMGASVKVEGDEVTIDGVNTLKPAALKSFGDHRTCMALTIAAMSADGDSSMEGVERVSKSFPGFFGALESLKKPVLRSSAAD